MDKKTLLTGAGGLVGLQVKADIRIDGKDQLDLRDWNATIKYFEETKPTQVIHCAARVGGVLANMNHMGEFFHDSMAMNLNVLEAARRTGVQKVVSFLSTCIYPEQAKYPLVETDLHSGEPHESNFAYAYAKRMLEVQSRAYRKQYGVNYICVVPTNIYGPNDNFSLDGGHVVPALIHKCYLAKKNGTPLTIWGSGNPLREFVYSEDMGKLINWSADNYEEESPIIFSNSNEISIKQLVYTVVEAYNFTGDIIFDTSKPEGQYRKPTDNTKLKSYLPDFKFTPLKDGVKKTVDWFVENYEGCRK
jgi:GDP-L-fucose synthase